MYAIGVASGRPIGMGLYLLGQAMVTAAQITAHYVNEYADFDTDRSVVHRTFFSGGSGVLVERELSPTVALNAARATSAIALLLAALVALTSPIAALLGVLALGVSWAYSIPPIRLLNTGWGELVTSLVVTVAVPMVGVTMTGTSPPPRLWWSMAILLPIHMAMMLVFELPDLETDDAAGKRVLAVRMGDRTTMRMAVALYVIAALTTAVSVFVLDSWPGSLVFHVIALAAVAAMFSSIGLDRYNRATASAVGVLVVIASGLLAVELVN